MGLPDVAPAFKCGRLVAGTPCGAPATHHVLFTWDGENGLCCDDHLAATRANGVDFHLYRPECSIGGAFWPHDGDRCIVDELA